MSFHMKKKKKRAMSSAEIRGVSEAILICSDLALTWAV